MKTAGEWQVLAINARYKPAEEVSSLSRLQPLQALVSKSFRHPTQ
ncbi:hypothetical protein [Photobacterium pectinilyticum]|nr:hypothetical protein [Photobacterium sp. ZSDE20]